MQMELLRFMELGKACPECGKKLSLILVEDLELMGDDALQWRCYHSHNGETTSPRLVATLYCHRLTPADRSTLIDIVKERYSGDATPSFEIELVEYDVRQQAVNDAIWQLAKEYGVRLTDHATDNQSIDFVSLWSDVAAKMTEQDLQTWLSIQPVVSEQDATLDTAPRLPEVMHELLKREFMSRHLSGFELSIPQVFGKELTLDFVERAAELAEFTWGESEAGQRPRQPKLRLSTANSPARNTDAVLAAYNEWVDALYAYAQTQTSQRA